MIEKDLLGYYILTCDQCGKEAGEDFEEFHDAVDFKQDKSNGWRSRKVAGGWEDVCDDCAY